MAKAGFLELEHIEGDIFHVHLTNEQVDLVATFFATVFFAATFFAATFFTSAILIRV